MKPILFWLFIAIVPCIAFSQSKIVKNYPVNKGQTVSFHFDFPKTVRFSTWDKNEVSVEATVKVEGVDDDSVFSIEKTESDGKIVIKNKLDMEKIPYSYFVSVNGVKHRFTNKADMDVFMKEQGSSVKSNYQTRDIEIVIDVKLPASINTEVNSVYGFVEVQDFKGPIKVDATYGGIEAKLNQQLIGKIKMTNRFGKIYTNLDLKPNELKEERFYTAINATPGKGPSYDFNSSYGNIYLRNP
ncbi:hypothetical protein [Pedobacter sp. Leaf132]|uniref:hypothetical protein n=1 Tax=Pedobacter sp. Leaf132 TaxID=2876557 RepID=UPI001E40A603|nr:hypothetical protein [Pedobacter sp. Leaf132]